VKVFPHEYKRVLGIARSAEAAFVPPQRRPHQEVARG